ncbi:uncharacterized protein OCT59_014722 [Rhizophagus irregularis]|uniref:Uncharacterized protein n=2 Tax=Rhizophagus irregularis TaxID=588596 RepID=A0A015K422_RHIIW|nr:hypothetical protein RirG_237340 [Rhizophagus irregularis DAOM 197198w]UZO22359.1 hypothetical protein OCT59_014722 [Rhizophagus irregularis]GBC44108.1 hypothetical protein GLOIN_2v1489934 [Rhizophagus irregularis DAOM 181602=DAOM 197198]
MYHSQENIDNSAHESNLTGFTNHNCNRLSQPTAETFIQPENINCNDPSCNCNYDASVMNNNNFSVAHATISLDHSTMSHSISNNNDIISPGNTNYQQSIFNDGSDNNINISPNDKYQQSMFNNTTSPPPPQFHPQYIDQNSPQTNVFPSLNSLGIVINSPQTYVIIMPNRQQDAYPNHSITDNLQTQFKQ